MSGAECVFASGQAWEGLSLEEALAGSRKVIACESARSGISVYDFPAPRESTAVIVGNEEEGLPRPVLKRADRVVSVPMPGPGMSSVNVAVAAAIVLYALSRDLARRKRPGRVLSRRRTDLLIHCPDDPYELGSLLRGVWAFGWRRVFLSDPAGVWFTRNRRVQLGGRAAARRHKNPLAVLDVGELDPSGYDAVLAASAPGEGTALSRLKLPDCRRLLIELGSGEGTVAGWGEKAEHFYVDYLNAGAGNRFRLSASIALSRLSDLLGP